MKEADWLAGRDPRLLLLGLGSKQRDDGRKIRLFVVGCCRLIWAVLPHEANRRAVEVAERYADDRAGPDEVAEAHAQALICLGDCRFRSSKWHAGMASVGALVTDRSLVGTALKVAETTQLASKPSTRPEVVEAQCSLLRDLFGNPFRPDTFANEWLTEEVVELARAIYDGRDFDSMAALGAALEAAGCSNPKVLEHCVSAEKHRRGCWVVDALTGRSER